MLNEQRKCMRELSRVNRGSDCSLVPFPLVRASELFVPSWTCDCRHD